MNHFETQYQNINKRIEIYVVLPNYCIIELYPPYIAMICQRL